MLFNENNNINLKRDLFYIIALFLMILCLFVPNWILGTSAIDIPCALDIASQSYPHTVFMTRVYRSHHFPLWDPHNCCGMPFLAFSHNSVFYPFIFIYLFFDFFNGSTVIVLVQLLITSISTYLLFRYLGRKYLTSIMCALSYTLSGLYFVLLHSKNDRTASWAPLILLATVMLAKNKINKGFILLLISFSLAFLGGDIESLFLILMFDFFFLVLLTRPADRLKSSLVFVLAIASGLLLAMLQFLPSLEMLYCSVRGQVFQFLYQFNLRRDAFNVIILLFSFIYPLPIPDLLAMGANPNLNLVYLGFFWLPFFIKNFSDPSSKRIKYIYIIFLLYFLSYALPGLKHLRALIPLVKGFVLPILAFYPISLIYLIMASSGFDNFLYQPSPRISKRTKIFFWLYALLCLFFAIVFNQTPALKIPLGILLFSFPFWNKIIKLNYSFLLICLLDIYATALWYFPRSNEPKYKLEPQFLKIASNTELKERYIVKAIPGCLRIFFGAGMIIKADTIDSNIRAPLRHYAELFILTFGKYYIENDMSIFFDSNIWRKLENINQDKLWLLNLLNVRWFFSGTQIPIETPGLRLILKESGSVYVYENKTFLPRAFPVNRVRVFSSEKEVFDLMANSNFDYQREILLSDIAAPQLASNEKDSSKIISLSRPSADQLYLIVRNYDPCYLFLSEVYYPGWRVYVDGEEKRIWRADYAFRAVYLEPGRHYLRFVYVPISFRIGLYFSLGSYIFGLVFLVLILRRFLRGKSTRYKILLVN